MRDFIRIIISIPYMTAMVLGPALPYVMGALIIVFAAGFGLSAVLF